MDRRTPEDALREKLILQERFQGGTASAANFVSADAHRSLRILCFVFDPRTIGVISGDEVRRRDL